jgi:DeoR/GlpR family transcriptional regulator of sugar metabolism
MTVEAASQLRVRTFLLGAAAADERGLYVASNIELPTKRALMEIADRVVLLADHTKFTRSAPVLLYGLDQLTTVVTDRPPPAPFGAELARHAVQLIVADEAVSPRSGSPSARTST